ncbi:helix-turn-helix transcriptional regulator, partial [Salmonella enterica]|nr:helix-turn-helix transcriptional regulator [Salmonella enterica]
QDTQTSDLDCYIDVFYIKKGVAELMFNAPPSIKLSPGEFIFLNRKCSDCFFLTGGQDTEILQTRVVPRGLYKDLIVYYGCYNSLYVLDSGHIDVIPVASEMISLLLKLQKSKSEAILSLEVPISLFFIHIYLNKVANSSLPFNNTGHQFFKLILEMIKSPDYPWRVKDMAKEYNMNPNSFISEFKKISGFTPCNFLKKTRLNRGRQLLENTDIPVAVIARQCGYNSHASFAFYFKKEYGLSPLKMRNNAQSKYMLEISERLNQ